MIDLQDETTATGVLLFSMQGQFARDATGIGEQFFRSKWEWTDAVEAERRRAEKGRETEALRRRNEQLEQQLEFQQLSFSYSGYSSC